MASEMTTEEMVEELRQALGTAHARAERYESLYAKAWAEIQEWRRIAGNRTPKGWRLDMYRLDDEFPEADAHDAARKEAGL